MVVDQKKFEIKIKGAPLCVDTWEIYRSIHKIMQECSGGAIKLKPPKVFWCCDGCNVKVEKTENLPDGWNRVGKDDFCENCAKKGSKK